MRLLIIGLVLAIHLFETVVAQLNQNHSRKPIPKLVNDVYDQDRYNKWLAYSLERHKFSSIEQGFGLVVLVILLLGPFARLEQLIATWTTNTILQSLLFLGIYNTLVVVLSIPFDFYKTFSIEERHGFNRTTKKTFLRDLVVNYLMTMILGGLIIAGIHYLFLAFQDNLWQFIFRTWVSLSVGMLLIVTFFNKLFLRLFNKFTPLPEGVLRARIEKLAADLNFKLTAILVMDASKRSTKSNAFFTGIGKTKEVVLYDTLLENMTDHEIMAVLAHELGHAVNKDIWRMLTQNIVMVALYAIGIGLVLQSPSLFTAFGFSGIHFGFATMLFSILIKPFSLIIGIGRNMLLRKAEYKADAFAAEHTDARWMISALKVLSRENLVNLNPHPFYVLLNYSHPTMYDRVNALNDL